MLTLREAGQRVDRKFPHYLCNFSVNPKLFPNSFNLLKSGERIKYQPMHTET